MTVEVTTTGLRPNGTPATDLPDVAWAVATGTADIITAAYDEPNLSLPDGLILGFRAVGPNLTTTPTFSPDGLTAHVITKRGGSALHSYDIPAALAECLVRYNLANTRWELLNPARPVIKGGTLDDAYVSISNGNSLVWRIFNDLTNGWLSFLYQSVVKVVFDVTNGCIGFFDATPFTSLGVPGISFKGVKSDNVTIVQNQNNSSGTNAGARFSISTAVANLYSLWQVNNNSLTSQLSDGLGITNGRLYDAAKHVFRRIDGTVLFTIGADGPVNPNTGTWGVDTGTATAYAVAYTPAVTALVDGMELKFRALNNNSGTTPTFSPNGLTAHTIVKRFSTAVAANDIVAGGEYTVRYNFANTRWVLMNPVVN